MSNGATSSAVSKLEFLCDALAEYAGSHDPTSKLYRLRNPIGLREFHAGKLGDFRSYRSWVHGYESALFDLKMKCSGKSASGLTQYSAIRDLAQYYGIEPKGVADYLSFALEDDKIGPETQLFVFLR